jgi:hypothetical protein
LKNFGLEPSIEYTNPYTPELSGKIEKSMATLWGRTRSMLNDTAVETEMRDSLWAECAATTRIAFSLIAKSGEKESA